MIWREGGRLRAAGKPGGVSMGDLAASGGYFISAPADVIVTQPGTLTGSIGVITGKPVLREMLGRAGVRTDTIAENPNATMFSLSRPFSEPEWDRINAWLDAIYRDFTEKVASGRRLTAERVHELARGRVWTGADAVRNGLADELLELLGRQPLDGAGLRDRDDLRDAARSEGGERRARRAASERLGSPSKSRISPSFPFSRT